MVAKTMEAAPSFVSLLGEHLRSVIVLWDTDFIVMMSHVSQVSDMFIY